MKWTVRKKAKTSEGETGRKTPTGLYEKLEKNAVRRCQDGDISGLETLYELYGEKVFRTCYRILGDHGSAEDETHEVFLHLFKKISRFRGHSRFSTWLYRLTTNHALNKLRQHEHQAGRLMEADNLEKRASNLPSPDHNLLLREKRDLVEVMLATLSVEQRTVIVLREIEGLSYAEIGEVLGLPAGTVMSRLHRARQELKKYPFEGNSTPGSSVQKDEVRQNQ